MALNHQEIRKALVDHVESDEKEHAGILQAIKEHAIVDVDLEHDSIIAAVEAHIEQTNKSHANLLAALDVHIAKEVV